MDEHLVEWLLEGEPWVAYRTRIDLLEQVDDDPRVKEAYSALLALPLITEMITELADWPGLVLKSHKKAGHFLHKLGFLADLGLKADNPGIREISDRIMAHQSDEGPFQVLVNIKPGYGGTGEDQLAWMLCDAPLVLHALVSFGFKDTPQVQRGLEYLVDLVRENGWPCSVSPYLGKFRGPGSKSDPCPYANLVMLKLLAQCPEMHSDPAVETGIETLLSLWEIRKTKRPYLFAMGTDFAKLKAPLVWYDILHLTEVLTQFPWVLGDARLVEMVEIVRRKADQDGKFTAESIWMDWKAWEFGQKKTPSRWITFLAHRIMSRTLST
jgi:hypothetical protein